MLFYPQNKEITEKNLTPLQPFWNTVFVCIVVYFWHLINFCTCQKDKKVTTQHEGNYSKFPKTKKIQLNPQIITRQNKTRPDSSHHKGYPASPTNLTFHLNVDVIIQHLVSKFWWTWAVLRIRIRQRHGSGSRFGSGSFYHHAKIVRKTLIPTTSL